MPRRFTERELAVMRICDRKGWTLGEWQALDEWEQIEWLAYDLRRMKNVSEMMAMVKKLPHLPDTGGLIALMLEMV